MHTVTINEKKLKKENVKKHSKPTIGTRGETKTTKT